MHNLFSILKPYWKPISLALSLMLVELLVEMWHPLLMAKIINEGIAYNDLPFVLKWGGFMVVLAVLGFIAGVANSFFAAHVSQNFGFDVRNLLFEKIQRFSLSNLHQYSTATLISRVTGDVTQLQNNVFMGLRIMMRAPLLTVGGIVMAFTVNAKLALILAVLMPLLIICLVWSMNKSFILFRTVRDRLDKTNGILRENLIGMRLIRVFVRFAHEIRRFTKANEDLMDRTMAALRLMEIVIPLLLLLMNLGVLAILWFGSLQVNAGSINVGEVVAIVNYATRMTAAFSAISMIVTVLSRSKASARRITEVLDATIDMIDGEETMPTGDAGAGKLVFDQVSFRYPGTAAPVLQSVSFTAEAGSTLAILGATGSGKSTLFQLIPRFYDVDEGRVLFDNRDVRMLRQDDLRNQIGYVHQEPLLFTGTVRENIMWGKPDATQEELLQAARDAQIHDTIMKLPQQYETMIGAKGINLSGGQRQRLTIARALIRKPKLLLLDDSTSALDLRTEARLLAAIKTYSCTIVMITQKISTAMQADKIILLEDGRVLAEGDHATLLRQSALYRQIVQSQSEEESIADGKAVE